MGAVEPARELRLKHCTLLQERSLVHSAKATRARRCTRISIQKGQATRLGPSASAVPTHDSGRVSARLRVRRCHLAFDAIRVPARPPTAIAVLYAPAVTRATDTLRTTSLARRLDRTAPTRRPSGLAIGKRALTLGTYCSRTSPGLGQNRVPYVVVVALVDPRRVAERIDRYVCQCLYGHHGQRPPADTGSADRIRDRRVDSRFQFHSRFGSMCVSRRGSSAAP